MTDNKETQATEEVADSSQDIIETADTEQQSKSTGMLRKGGMYSGLKISVKTANIIAIVAVLLLAVVFVYAVATADGFTVSFDSNGGTDVESFQVEYGVYGEITAVPTREGYTFGGWYIDESLSEQYDPEGTIESDITLYAKWVANE